MRVEEIDVHPPAHSGRRRIGVLCLTLQGLFLPVGAQADPDPLPSRDLARRIRSARIAGQMGRVDEQRRLLEEIAREHPENDLALTALMDLYLTFPRDSSQAAAARESLRKLLLDPARRPPVVILQAFAYNAATTDGDLDLLVRALDRRVSGRAPDPEALLLLAGLHTERGRREEARAVLGRLLEMRGDPEVRQRCIYLDIELERWREALPLLEQQRKVLGPSKLRLPAAIIYASLGRANELREEVAAIRTESLYLTRMLKGPLIRVGFALHDAGFEADARAWFALLHERFSGDPAITSIRAGLFGEGETMTLEDPDDLAWEGPIDLVNEGSALLSGGDAHSAYAVLRRAVALMEDNDMAWFNLGLAAADLQKWTEAEEAFHRAVTLNPRFVKGFIQRAQARLRLGRIDEAEADARLALSLDGRARDAMLILHHCARTRGDDEAAAEWMLRYNGS